MGARNTDMARYAAALVLLSLLWFEAVKCGLRRITASAQH